MRSPTFLLVGLTSLVTAINSLSADVLISEVMTSNMDTLQAADGSSPDWFELHNDGAESVNLAGYFLTDDPDDLSKWEVPAADLAANGYLVIFASGDDLRDPAGELATNFKLKKWGRIPRPSRA